MSGARHRVRSYFAERADPQRAAMAQRYFKTALGDYGHGDRFHGLTVPEVRRAVREFRGLTLDDIAAVLDSEFHEERLLALLLLVERYRRGDDAQREAVYRMYIGGTARINNWDLVDSSAPHIVGAHLEHRSRRVLRRLAKSRDLWERRIAMLSTLYFIHQGDFDDALAIAAILVADSHDLIHKAVGWMLREIGKRNRAVEEEFLARFAATMPRTMLRYAIERFPETLRRRYLAMRSA